MFFGNVIMYLTGANFLVFFSLVHILHFSKLQKLVSLFTIV